MRINELTAGHPNLFWNKEENRFEIEASEMMAMGVVPLGNPNVQKWLQINNPITGISKIFQHRPNRDKIRNVEGELLTEVYFCEDDRSLQLHVIND